MPTQKKKTHTLELKFSIMSQFQCVCTRLLALPQCVWYIPQSVIYEFSCLTLHLHLPSHSVVLLSVWGQLVLLNFSQENVLTIKPSTHSSSTWRLIQLQKVILILQYQHSEDISGRGEYIYVHGLIKQGS